MHDRFQQIESLREKLTEETQQLNRQLSLYDQASAKIRALEEEKAHLEARVHKLDAEVSTCELSREGLKRDKTTVQFSYNYFI